MRALWLKDGVGRQTPSKWLPSQRVRDSNALQPGWQGHGETRSGTPGQLPSGILRQRESSPLTHSQRPGVFSNGPYTDMVTTSDNSFRHIFIHARCEQQIARLLCPTRPRACPSCSNILFYSLSLWHTPQKQMVNFLQLFTFVYFLTLIQTDKSKDPDISSMFRESCIRNSFKYPNGLTLKCWPLKGCGCSTSYLNP